MNNIFESAYFGKPYKTRGGDKALFQYKDSSLAHLFTEDSEIDVYLIDGCVDSRFFNESNDIVSEWKEELNEEDVKKKAKEDNPYEFLGYYETRDFDKLHKVFNEGYFKGYSVAYNKQ